MRRCSAVIRSAVSFTVPFSTFELSTPFIFRQYQKRQASLTSAIARGIRKSQADSYETRSKNWNETVGSYASGAKHEDRRASPTTESEKTFMAQSETSRTRGLPTMFYQPIIKSVPRKRDQMERAQDSFTDPSIIGHIKRRKDVESLRSDGEGRENVQKPQRKSDLKRPPRVQLSAPLSVPYTTPASEFLFGKYAVEAALKSGRRQLYQFYIVERLVDDSWSAADYYMYGLALAAKVSVKRVGADWNKLLRKMSQNRPHNGYVLEASPLPQLPVLSLNNFSKKDFSLTLDHQSSEEVAVNGRNNQLPNLSRGRRYPFLLMLDRILDPGNLGAIIRTATYFGVDGIIIVHHGTAPFSGATHKASAGSMEFMPLLKTNNSVGFMKVSQAMGWRFFAAVAPDSRSMSSPAEDPAATAPTALALKKHPCVLILGEEGQGIQPRHLNQADGIVSVERFGGAEAGLECLNVSVAAGLLCDHFVSGAFSSEPKISLQTDRKSTSNDKLF